MSILAGSAIVLAIFGVLIGLAMHYAKKSERERIHRWLAEQVNESKEVFDEARREARGGAADRARDRLSESSRR